MQHIIVIKYTLAILQYQNNVEISVSMNKHIHTYEKVTGPIAFL